VINARTLGERLFEAYLAEHDYPEPAFEPDLGVAKRPDYLVARAGSEAVCEVKEFDAKANPPPVGGGMRSMVDVLRPVRQKIRDAAKQLKPLRDCGRPLVVVLANPQGAFVRLGPREMVWAMYGDPAFEFTADPATGESVGEAGFVVTRNGRLRNDHPYVSAVVVVSARDRAIDFYDELIADMEPASPDEKMEAIYCARDRGHVPEGYYHRADVYRTMSPEAVELSPQLFNAPQDRRFEFDAEAGAYVWTRGRPLA
jgi:hypothetical protein